MKRGAALALALGLAGCGGSSLSTSQLRARATRICDVAQRRADRIPTPTMPSGGPSYLRLGIGVLAPEVRQLRALPAPDDLAGEYRGALDAVRDETSALRASLKRLRAGDDPVLAIKMLQQKLAPLEQSADLAWAKLAIPSCMDR